MESTITKEYSAILGFLTLAYQKYIRYNSVKYYPASKDIIISNKDMIISVFNDFFEKTVKLPKDVEALSLNSKDIDMRVKWAFGMMEYFTTNECCGIQYYKNGTIENSDKLDAVEFLEKTMDNGYFCISDALLGILLCKINWFGIKYMYEDLMSYPVKIYE